MLRLYQSSVCPVGAEQTAAARVYGKVIDSAAFLPLTPPPARPFHVHPHGIC